MGGCPVSYHPSKTIMGNIHGTPCKPLIQTCLKYAVTMSDHTAMQVAAQCKIPWVKFSAACQGRILLAPEELERVGEMLEVHPAELLGMTNIS